MSIGQVVHGGELTTGASCTWATCHGESFHRASCLLDQLSIRQIVHGGELSMGASCPWERVVHGASHHGVKFHRVNCGGVMIRPEDISSLSIAPRMIHIRSHYILVSLCPMSKTSHGC